MGLLDNLKAKLGPAKDKVEDKVGDLAQQHEGRIGHGLDKVARAVDAKTKGKYSERIETGTSKAKDALGKIAHKDHPDGGPTPPPPPPAS
ncbi:antitoxin [Streptomyces sp. NPDC051211]|uniref:antitoxin n=1 Tax=Streptomyces sp. NPDC051211 TaxID=3154643 RepID=UPI00344C346D